MVGQTTTKCSAIPLSSVWYKLFVPVCGFLGRLKIMCEESEDIFFGRVKKWTLKISPKFSHVKTEECRPAENVKIKSEDPEINSDWLTPSWPSVYTVFMIQVSNLVRLVNQLGSKWTLKLLKNINHENHGKSFIMYLSKELQCVTPFLRLGKLKSNHSLNCKRWGS